MILNRSGPYEINDIEKDIRAEDFPEGSLLNKLLTAVKGEHAAIICLKVLAEEAAKDPQRRIHIRNWSGIIRKANDRDFNRKTHSPRTTSGGKNDLR